MTMRLTCWHLPRLDVAAEPCGRGGTGPCLHRLRDLLCDVCRRVALNKRAVFWLNVMNGKRDAKETEWQYDPSLCSFSCTRAVAPAGCFVLRS